MDWTTYDERDIQDIIRHLPLPREYEMPKGKMGSFFISETQASCR